MGIILRRLRSKRKTQVVTRNNENLQKEVRPNDSSREHLQAEFVLTRKA